MAPFSSVSNALAEPVTLRVKGTHGVLLMLSMPPATMMSRWPVCKFCVASMMAFMPEAQTCVKRLSDSRTQRTITLYPTHLVDGSGLDVLRHAAAEHDLPRWVLANAGLEDVAKVELFNLLRLEVGLRKRALDGAHAQSRRVELGQDALERAHWRPCGAADL